MREDGYNWRSRLRRSDKFESISIFRHPIPLQFCKCSSFQIDTLSKKKIVATNYTCGHLDAVGQKKAARAVSSAESRKEAGRARRTRRGFSHAESSSACVTTISSIALSDRILFLRFLLIIVFKISRSRTLPGDHAWPCRFFAVKATAQIWRRVKNLRFSPKSKPKSCELCSS